MKYPCRNCTYFDACGDSERTEPCKGRKSKPQKRKYYHMIIQYHGDLTGKTRREYISRHQGAAPKGWKCVGVCGFHEK